jgi:hypothetical protein
MEQRHYQDQINDAHGQQFHHGFALRSGRRLR